MVTVPKSVCGPMRNWPASGEEIGRQAQRRGAQHEQLVGQRVHPGQVGPDRGLQPWHLGRVDVGLEPEPVDVGVAGRGVRPDRERLLEVRGSLGPLGVPVGLHPGRQPPPPAHGHRVPLLDLARQREEGPRLLPDSRAQPFRHPMPADQEEPHAAQRGVDLGGDPGPLRVAAAEPRPQVDHRNRCHDPHYPIPRSLHLSSGLPAAMLHLMARIQAVSAAR
jgi:hypothetical protein